jgi:hypothetical protein
LDTFKIPNQTLDDDRLRLRTYTLITDAVVAATLISAGFSVYFLTSRPSESAAQTATPRPFVALAPTLGGTVVHGEW